MPSITDFATPLARKRSGVELGYYDLPNTYRLIATDQAAYITFYKNAAHGRNSPCVYARRPRLMYDVALVLFDAAWRGSCSAATEGEMDCRS